MELQNESGKLISFDEQYLARCVDLFYDVFTSPEWGYDWLVKENVERYFIDMLNTPGSLCYLYFVGGDLAGACFGGILDYFRTNQYCIKEIFVDIHRQRGGIGGSMLKAIEEDIHKRGAHNVTLYTTRDIGAFNFYEKNGYVTSPNSVYMVKFIGLPRNS